MQKAADLGGMCDVGSSLLFTASVSASTGTRCIGMNVSDLMYLMRTVLTWYRCACIGITAITRRWPLAESVAMQITIIGITAGPCLDAPDLAELRALGPARTNTDRLVATFDAAAAFMCRRGRGQIDRKSVV